MGELTVAGAQLAVTAVVLGGLTVSTGCTLRAALRHVAARPIAPVLAKVATPATIGGGQHSDVALALIRRVV